MSEMRFNCVLILDSIPEGELNTARKLAEDLETIASAKPGTPGIKLIPIKFVNDFIKCFSQLVHEIKKTGSYPLIHLEAHGCTDGLQLADKSQISWKYFKEILVPINISMELNLMLVLGSCHGGTFVTCMDPDDRAPFWGLIGPTSELNVGQIEKDFRLFYTTLFNTLSPYEALIAFNRNIPENRYYIKTAEEFFYEVWKAYLKNHGSKNQLKKLAQRKRKQLKTERVYPLPSINELKREVIGLQYRIFDQFRDKYFMYDLFPNHKNRFPITYKEAKRKAAE